MQRFFLILLKKELYEFFKNIKFWIFLLFILICMYGLDFFKLSISDNTAIFLILLLISQYMFDSCINDIKSGAVLFFINIKCNTVKIILAKFCFVALLGFFLFFILLFSIMQNVAIIDLFWLFPLFMFTTVLTYNAVIITKKSDLLASTLVMGFILLVLKGVMMLQSIYIRAAVLLLATLIIVYISSILFEKPMYRAELII